MSEISTKPYMLRAIYEWCTDNGYTPYLAVQVDASTTVPMEFVKKGEIVLNISFGATHGLKMDNEAIHFHARFGGVSREIYVPVHNVLAIYANENGQGMAFEVEKNGAKTDAAPAAAALAAAVTEAPAPTLAAVPSPAPDSIGSDDEPPRPRPTLTRIK